MLKVKNKVFMIFAVLLIILSTCLVLKINFSNKTSVSADTITYDETRYTRGSGLYQFASNRTISNFIPATTYLSKSGNKLSVNSSYETTAGEVYLNDYDMSGVTSLSDMFLGAFSEGCSKVTAITFGPNFDTSNVTDMRYMFDNCGGLTSLDVSNFDTSNVTVMFGMFSRCSGLTSLDVSNFDTSNVTDMSYMFRGCGGLTSLDVSNFDTSKVTDICGMFYGCSSLTSLDVSNFDTSNVEDMHSMFDSCRSLTSLDVSNFDTSNVTNMGSMFEDCSSLTSLDVSNFDTSNVTYMSRMFDYCSGLTSLDLSNFDTSKISFMYYMFGNCSNLTSLDLSSFDMSSVERDHIQGPDISGDHRPPSILVGSDVSTQSAGVTIETMLSGCTNLTRIKAPKKMGDNTLVLPDSSNNHYAVTNAPSNQLTEITSDHEGKVIELYDANNVSLAPAITTPDTPSTGVIANSMAVVMLCCTVVLIVWFATKKKKYSK